MAQKTARPKKLPSLKLNLLYTQDTTPQLPLKFMRWLLSYGRFIAIFVEVIVIASFIARFKLDADLTNLKTKINNQVPILESLTNDENTIKVTQLKLTTLQQTYNSNPQWQKILSQLTNLMPIGVRLHSLNLDYSNQTTQFKLVAESNSSNDLNLFLKGLKTSPQFNQVHLDSISYNLGAISFSLSGVIK